MAQADLVVTRAGLLASELEIGQLAVVTAKISNEGNEFAPSTTSVLSLHTPDGDFVTELASSVTPALNPGERRTVEFVYRVRIPGNYLFAVSPDAGESVVELSEDNIACVGPAGGDCQLALFRAATTTTRVTNNPVILVHGLNSNSRTWDRLANAFVARYGWREGARLDYCLNPDGNQATSDGYVLPFTGGVEPADFYRVNFDVSNLGAAFVGDDGVDFNDHRSDESAIVKQGMAVAHAVEVVLAATGAQEVILVGHSMGGLASREYLQHPNLWVGQTPRVAKLVTVGTPHGGSNVDFGDLSIFAGADNRSEAVRDLRYGNHDGAGQYLTGGSELLIDVGDFRNRDVDCSGAVGDLVVSGLNQEPWPQYVDIAAIAGEGRLHLPGLGINGDGTVRYEHADPSQHLRANTPFRSVHSDMFAIDEDHRDLHTEHVGTVIRAMDEAGLTDMPRRLSLNGITDGRVDRLADNNLDRDDYGRYDYDQYYLDVPAAGWLSMALLNHSSALGGLGLFNMEGDLVSAIASDSAQQLSVEIDAPGLYYVLVESDPILYPQTSPYYLANEFTPFSELQADLTTTDTRGCAPLAVEYADRSGGNPDSIRWTFPGGTPAISAEAAPTVTYATPGRHDATLEVFRGTRSDEVTLRRVVRVDDTVSAAFAVEDLGERAFGFSHAGEGYESELTYRWDFGDGVTSSRAALQHTFASVGLHEVGLEVRNGCGTTSHREIVTVADASSLDARNVVGARLFPNPTDDHVTVDFGEAASEVIAVEVIDLLGRRVLNTIPSRSASSVDLSLGAYPAGTYFVRARTRSGARTWRLERIARP